MADHSIARNIYLIGPQCTGKTTLLLALEKFFSSSCDSTHLTHLCGPPAFIHEVVRQIMSKEGFSTHDIKSSRWQELQSRTLKSQCLAEEKLQGQWFISDRSALDPLVYSQQQGNVTRELRKSEHWMASRQRMRLGLVVLCEAGNKAWLSSDDVRLHYADEQEWEALNNQFRDLLEAETIPYVILHKDVTDIAERVEFVVAKLFALPDLGR